MIFGFLQLSSELIYAAKYFNILNPHIRLCCSMLPLALDLGDLTTNVENTQVSDTGTAFSIVNGEHQTGILDTGVTVQDQVPDSGVALY